MEDMPKTYEIEHEKLLILETPHVLVPKEEPSEETQHPETSFACRIQETCGIAQYSGQVCGITTPAVTGVPTYKMEPSDPGLYYPEADLHTGAGPGGFQPWVPGAGPDLESADFMHGYPSSADGHPADLFHHQHNSFNVKDEPGGGLRPEYPYYGNSDLVNLYVHMGRKEKRKNHDSLPGTLTRDERKVINSVNRNNELICI